MLKSRVVRIGNIAIGGELPIVVQSMTNTNTNDINASVEQCIRIFDAGASMVRFTTQGLKEVENLKKIKAELVKRAYLNPIIADVHYSPHAAKAGKKSDKMSPKWQYHIRIPVKSVYSIQMDQLLPSLQGLK